MGKILGIGLPKTGTSSLHESLRILGYKSVHFTHDDGPFKKQIQIPEDLRDKRYNYDAASDINVCGFFEKYDKMYPNSKFIFTVRETEGWLSSICLNHHYVAYYRGNISEPVYLENETSNPREQYRLDCLHSVFKKIPKYFDREHYLKCYIEYSTRVYNHFKNRLNDLLIMNICAGDGWEKLCKFLGKKVPQEKFPRKEKGCYRWRDNNERPPHGLFY